MIQDDRVKQARKKKVGEKSFGAKVWMVACEAESIRFKETGQNERLKGEREKTAVQRHDLLAVGWHGACHRFG